MPGRWSVAAPSDTLGIPGPARDGTMAAGSNFARYGVSMCGAGAVVVAKLKIKKSVS